MKKDLSKCISFTYGPKEKNPFTGVWDSAYLVPCIENQRGLTRNYVVVTCTPSMNGIYVYDATKLDSYKKWTNGKKVCVYVPVADCKFTSMDRFKELCKSEPNNESYKFIEAEIKKQQKKWYNNDVKNRDYEYKRGKPDWML